MSASGRLAWRSSKVSSRSVLSGSFSSTARVRRRLLTETTGFSLSQVLEDDAKTFVGAFYRTVLFEAIAADEGLGTEGLEL